MNHPPETVDRFIELRAQGIAYSRLVQELGVSKPTLISWSRKYQHQIHNLMALEAESLSDRCKTSRRHCLEALGEDLKRVRDEIAARDLKDISTGRLIALAALLRAEALRTSSPVRFSEAIPEHRAEAESEAAIAVDWEG